MKLLVLGAGLQGSACAHNLLQDDQVERVTLADRAPDRLPGFLTGKQDDRLTTARIDASDFNRTVELIRGHQAVMCALPYYLNEPMTKAAIEAGAHFADLGGNTEIVVRQQALDQSARAKQLSIVP